MREFKIIICIYVFLICAIKASSNTSLPELYKELNEALTKREFYIEQKQKTIDNYKLELLKANILEEEYELCEKMTDEYAYFNLDSVFFYSNKTIDIASELKDEHNYYKALIRQAYILSWQGYFHEPIEILESINIETLSADLRSNYYYAYMMIFHFRQQKVMNTQYRILYRAETLKYTDLYLASVPVTADKSGLYLTALAYKYYQLKDYKTAAVYLKEALQKDDIKPDRRVNVLYILYLAYNEMGEKFEEDAETYLLQSAILAIKVAKLRERSLRKIALLQNEKENYSLAFKCIDAAIANMEACQNTDFKQTAESTRLTIQDAYNKYEDKEQLVLFYCAIGALILSVLMLGVLIYVFNKNKLLKIAQEVSLSNEKKLTLFIKKLSASNDLNNKAIVYWLNISYNYISKLDMVKKTVIRKIEGKQPLNSIKLELDDLIDIKEERLRLYRDFDNTFYKVYPNFISSINSFLQKEYHFSKNDLDIENTRTSTELRILALIKLGLNDNKQIASFLQLTVQSIYNYRSIIKSRAINPDTFEEDFDKIGLEVIVSMNID